MAFIIGIDTGGTYTDAALVDSSQHKVLATAKALTTRGNLAIGISEALKAIFAAEATLKGADVSLVCLSTTLATNAIVEGHGSAIGVILAGFDPRMRERTGIEAALPDAKILSVSGGHTYSGTPKAALDLPAVEAFIAANPQIEAYCVAAEYSVRNPAHEQGIGALIEAAGKPVTLSVDLAHALDAPKRALTAALNARIISRIVALIGAVRQSMAECGIAAPLKVVKGDGTLSSDSAIMRRPIETVLSGPAASVIGAKFLSGLSDFTVSDIGGTTTDVAVLEKGWPRLNAQGALVGTHRTLVRAVDMRTYALGGDSEVDIHEVSNTVFLASGRIVPISLLGQRFPAVATQLAAILADNESVPYAGRFVLLPFGTLRPDRPCPADLADLYARITPEPVPMHQLARSPRDMRSLQRLVKLGLAHCAGFTPSDAAHILDRQSQWSRPVAVQGALALVRWRRMASPRAGETEARAFAQEVFEAVIRASGRCILETITGQSLSPEDPFINAVLGGTHHFRGLKVGISPAAPIVAVGGPAAIFYPELGHRLQCETLLPIHGDVANAVGAAAGVIKVQAVVEITSQGLGNYRIHASGPPVECFDAKEALALAKTLAEQDANTQATELGLASGTISHRVERIDLPDTSDDKGLIAATHTAEIWGGAG